MDRVFTSVDEIAALIEASVQKGIQAALAAKDGERLLSGEETCRVFSPAISRQTLSAWTKAGLLPSRVINRKYYYRLSDVMEAGKTLKKYKTR